MVDLSCKPLWQTDPPPLLTVQQAGYFLFHEDSERVAKRVRRLLDAGRITPTMVGKRKWISRPEIEKFLTREEMPDDDDGA